MAYFRHRLAIYNGFLLCTARTLLWIALPDGLHEPLACSLLRLAITNGLLYETARILFWLTLLYGSLFYIGLLSSLARFLRRLTIMVGSHNLSAFF